MRDGTVRRASGWSSPARRRTAMAACLLLASAAAMLAALAGCYEQEANPTGRSDATGSLSVVFDEHLEYRKEDYESIVRNHIGTGMPNVTLEPQRYLSQDEIETAVESADGFDVVVARAEEIDKLRDEGFIDSNYRAFNVGTVYALDMPRLWAVRKEGSGVELPETRILGGDDDVGSREYRLAYLPGSELRLAICDEETDEGRAANIALAFLGLYSDEDGTGGAYSDDIADQVTTVADAAEAFRLVKDGACDIAFVYSWDLAKSEAEGAEAFYDVSMYLPDAGIEYKAAVLKSSKNPDAARRWLDIVYRLT